MSYPSRKITATRLWALPPSTMRRDLIRGEVIETMPPGGIHGAIAVALAALLRRWSRSGRGYVGVEARYILAHDPDTVRGPNVSYVRAERIPVSGIPEGFWDLAPDLAVEVVSPNETAEEVRDKVRDFPAAGTPLVWTIYPRSREVIVHTPDGLARTYKSGDILAYPAVLPGLQCSVDELFS